MEVKAVYQLLSLSMPSPLTFFQRHITCLEFFLADCQDSTLDVSVQPGTPTEDKKPHVKLQELEPPTPILHNPQRCGNLTLIVPHCRRLWSRCITSVLRSKFHIAESCSPLSLWFLLWLFLFFLTVWGLFCSSLLRADSLWRLFGKMSTKVSAASVRHPQNLNGFSKFKDFIQLMWIFTTKTNIWGSFFRRLKKIK